MQSCRPRGQAVVEEPVLRVRMVVLVVINGFTRSVLYDLRKSPKIYGVLRSSNRYRESDGRVIGDVRVGKRPISWIGRRGIRSMEYDSAPSRTRFYFGYW